MYLKNKLRTAIWDYACMHEYSVTFCLCGESCAIELKIAFQHILCKYCKPNVKEVDVCIHVLHNHGNFIHGIKRGGWTHARTHTRTHILVSKT
jgi:hypothetical protein